MRINFEKMMTFLSSCVKNYRYAASVVSSTTKTKKTLPILLNFILQYTIIGQRDHQQ